MSGLITYNRGSHVDFTSYAKLAVLLVNEHDRLRSLDSLRELLAETGRKEAAARANRRDLDAICELREELTGVFESAARGDGADAVERLNGLLVRHPVHPQISGHDDQPWHMHLTEGGRVADTLAVGSVMGLATVVTSLGMDRLGICQAPLCRNAYLDTSSNRSRRYCSERCANRVNVANYRARKRGTARRKATRGQ
ncbi:CGNR zinc finger domain-containing protein [Microtetraspora malaysiensis]|uniref:CGNR zinc finger domain-containing protein n=1 Tax=Microtetraspora malaysiensis TaxID=161358 RepID=A0ABW6SVZ7_9ACTN